MRQPRHCSVRKVLIARWTSIIALLCWVVSYSPSSVRKGGGLTELTAGGYPLFAMAEESPLDLLLGIPSLPGTGSSMIPSPSGSSVSVSSRSAPSSYFGDTDGDGDDNMDTDESTPPSSGDDWVSSTASGSEFSEPSASRSNDYWDDGEESEGAPGSTVRGKIAPVSLGSAWDSSSPPIPLESLAPPRSSASAFMTARESTSPSEESERSSAGSSRSARPSTSSSDGSESSSASPSLSGRPSTPSSNDSDLHPQGSIGSASSLAAPPPSASTPVATCQRFTVAPTATWVHFMGTAEMHVKTSDDLQELETNTTSPNVIQGTTYVSMNGTIREVGDETRTRSTGWGVVGTFRKGFCMPDGHAGEPYRFEGHHGVANALQMQGVVDEDGQISVSSERPFVVSYDDAKSLLVKVQRTDDFWETVACCNLVPPFPEIPEEWTADIESNLVKMRNTVYKREFFSRPRQKVRVEQEANGRQLISFVDMDKRETQVVFPNRTCIVQDSMDFKIDDIEYGFLGAVSTLDFFSRLIGIKNFTYIPSAQAVRGVDVEEWRAKYTEAGTDRNYNVSFFFSRDTWQVNDNLYRRDLRRIYVLDDDLEEDDSDGVMQYHEFYRMRPHLASNPDTIFDPCSISDEVSGCGCDGGATGAANFSEGSRPSASGGGMHLNSEANGNNLEGGPGQRQVSGNCSMGLSVATVAGIGIGLVLATAAAVSVGWYIYMKSRPDAWAFRFSQKERSFWKK